MRVQAYTSTRDEHAVHNLASAVVEHLDRELFLTSLEIGDELNGHIRKIDNHTSSSKSGAKLVLFSDIRKKNRKKSKR